MKQDRSTLASTMLLSIPKNVEDQRTAPKPSMTPRIKQPDNTRTDEQRANEDKDVLPLHAIYDIVLITDTSGLINNANERAVSLLGYNIENLKKLHVGDVISGIDNNMMTSILDHIKSRKFVLVDGYCVCNSGKNFPSEIAVSKVLLADRENTCFFIRDVSRRREAEEKLEQSVKLKSLHMLAGSVSHDLSNLLTSVIGHLEIGLGSLPDDAPSKDDLLEALKNARKMAMLSYRMRAFSGKGVMQESMVELNGLIRETGARISKQIPEQIRLDIITGPSPINAVGEPDLLETIAENLLENAVEAIGKSNGVVMISSSIEKLDVDFISEHSMEKDIKPGTYACITITDTGCGIDDITRANMFEPFLSTKGAGRGLGLPEVQGIVTVFGGAIAVKSEVGKGSSFKVFLPTFDVDKTKSGPVEKHIAKSPIHATILVIDDEDSIRRYLERVLKLNGISVFMAENGKKGVEQFRAHADEIDLVLLDMIMPDSTGDKVLKEIRNIRKNIKILLLTGYTDKIPHNAFGDDKPTGIIHKPFSTKDFIDILKEALGSGAEKTGNH